MLNSGNFQRVMPKNTLKHEQIIGNRQESLNHRIKERFADHLTSITDHQVEFFPTSPWSSVYC